MTSLTMVFYAGEYHGDIDALTHLCDLTGSAVPDGRPPFTTLEEARRVLETCTKLYSTPTLPALALTVFIGRKKRGKTTPLAQLDVLLQDGLARASVFSKDAPRVAMEPVAVDSEDDVATIALKVLAGINGG
jgi:hypothetical protein